MTSGHDEVEAREELASTSSTISTGGYPNVLFLGTASACPSNVRNLSSILFTINPKQSILLDCGEYTTAQINRYFGAERDFNEALCQIKLVFISHDHLDHHYGLYGLIRRRREAFAALGRDYERLALAHPKTLNRIFTGSQIFFGQNEQLNDLVDFVANERISLAVKGYVAVKSFRAIMVEHVPYSYGCVIELDEPIGYIYLFYKYIIK